MSTLKKLHKWPGFIIALLLLYYGVTGILMNHRVLLSGIDVNRNFLPKEYQYKNWNNSAIKGSLIISSDSVLVYGSIGVWVTDSTFVNYSSLNNGFPKGTDNRKIFAIHRSTDGQLYAATQFGLFAFNQQTYSWDKIKLDVKIERFVGIESVGDTIFAINRSYLFKGKSEGTRTIFEKIELNRPHGYDGKVTLFETIWQIHSGEIMGLPGQLVVDFLGLVTIFLSITGIIYFIFPKWLKIRKKKGLPVSKIAETNRWSLKWHNKTGVSLFLFLILLFFTGMFLRPPLLIAIANLRVAPIKYSNLDQPNPWNDKLRDILYNEEKDLFLISTSDGMFHFRRNSRIPIQFQFQPPISVMGINTFEKFNNGKFLVGSFSGLYVWNPSDPEIFDLIQEKPYQKEKPGFPIGDFKITGMITDANGRNYIVDYDRGVLPLGHNNVFPIMPKNVVEASKMSLWNLSLEIHTGRIFKNLLGNFYILLVPLSGLISIMVLVSGYLVYRNKLKRKK